MKKFGPEKTQLKNEETSELKKRIMKIRWTDKAYNKEGLKRIKGGRGKILAITTRSSLIGHQLRHNNF